MRYQICSKTEKNCFPISWKKIPESVMESIPPNYIYNTLHVSEDGDVGIKSVVYFKPVSRFKRGVKCFYLEKDIEFGV